MGRVHLLAAIFGIVAQTAFSHNCDGRFPNQVPVTQIGEKCYGFVITEKRVYVEAEKTCENHGGTLALVKTPDINLKLASFLKHLGIYSTVWIGLNDIDNEHIYMWEDKTRMIYNNFKKGQGLVNDYDNNEQDCIAMDHSGYWFDLHCLVIEYWFEYTYVRKNYICEFKPTSESVSTPVPKTSVHPHVTDRSGECDGRYPNHVPVILIDNNCYAFVDTVKKEYVDAKLTCEAYGGSLAIVKSSYINKRLAYVLTQLHNAAMFWIGLHDTVVEDFYMWLDGTNMTYNNFKEGEGNRGILYHHDEDCVAMNRSGYWFDFECASEYILGFQYVDATKYFICEFGLSSPPTTTGPSSTTTISITTPSTSTISKATGRTPGFTTKISTATVMQTTNILTSTLSTTPTTTPTPTTTTPTNTSTPTTTSPTNIPTSTIATTPTNTPTPTTTSPTNTSTSTITTTPTNTPTPPTTTPTPTSSSSTTSPPIITTSIFTTTSKTTPKTTTLTTVTTTSTTLTPTTAQLITTTTTKCPIFKCDLKCNLSGYQINAETGCSICACDE